MTAAPSCALISVVYMLLMVYIYFTAVNVMDAGPMLVADVAHKVLRTDTVLDYLYPLWNCGACIGSSGLLISILILLGRQEICARWPPLHW